MKDLKKEVRKEKEKEEKDEMIVVGFMVCFWIINKDCV